MNNDNTIHLRATSKSLPTKYTCEICGSIEEKQFQFYCHLKYHYEPETAKLFANRSREDIKIEVKLINF